LWIRQLFRSQRKAQRPSRLLSYPLAVRTWVVLGRDGLIQGRNAFLLWVSHGNPENVRVLAIGVHAEQFTMTVLHLVRKLIYFDLYTGGNLQWEVHFKWQTSIWLTQSHESAHLTTVSSAAKQPCGVCRPVVMWKSQCCRRTTWHSPCLLSTYLDGPAFSSKFGQFREKKYEVSELHLH